MTTTMSERRGQLYVEFLEELFTQFANPSMFMPLDMLTASAEDKQAFMSQQVSAFIAKWTPRLMLGASADVYKFFAAMTTAGRVKGDAKTKTRAVMYAMDDLVRVIRRELGEDNEGFERGDFVRPFAPDLI